MKSLQTFNCSGRLW